MPKKKESTTEAKNQVQENQIIPNTLLTQSNNLNTPKIKGNLKNYPRDENYEYVTPARLRRTYTFKDLVSTKILLEGEQYSHLQIRGYMLGFTWDEYLRNLILKDQTENPHSIIRK